MFYSMFNYHNTGSSTYTSDGLFSNFNFSDYASLRNGSYYKLLKASFALNTDSSSKSSSKTSKRTNSDYNYWDYNEKIKGKSEETSVSRDSANTLSNIQKDASDLVNASETLLSKSSSSPFAEKKATDDDTSGYDTDKIYKAVSSYVTEYNSLVKSSSKSNVGAVTASRSSMLSYTSSNEELLDSVGITVDTKNRTLSIDKEKFGNADMETVKKLFQGNNSYAAKVSATASAIKSHAMYEATRAATYTAYGTYSSNYTSSYNDYF